MGIHKNICKSPVDQVVTAYIQLEKYDELNASLQRAGFSSISSLLRHKVKNRKVVAKKSENTLDILMFELSSIRSTLNYMNLNINVIRKGLDDQVWTEAEGSVKLEIEHMLRQGGMNIPALFNLITKLSYVWLPE